MSETSAKSFTQSWIQALMMAAEHPATRTIKPCLEWIDKVSMHKVGSDRTEAANDLWNYGQENCLTSVMTIAPTTQTRWQFRDDERFLFDRREPASISSLEDWLQHLGLEAAVFPLTAEVTNSDWSTLVRQEAVRHQQPVSSSAVGKEKTLHPACQARWNGESWTIGFDEMPWLQLKSDDVANVRRPTLMSIEDQLLFALAEAESKLSPKHVSQNFEIQDVGEWRNCLANLARLHSQVLDAPHSYQPSTRRIWNCVWPVVLREQNLLRGQADLSAIRPEIAWCIESAAKFTVWMFVFAKLVCQIQAGMGLGICADYTDEV